MINRNRSLFNPHHTHTHTHTKPGITYAATFIVRLKCDGTRAETRFRLSPKRMSPFKSAGSSVQSTAGSRGVRISGSNAGYTTFRGSVRILANHTIHQFPLHFHSRAHRVPSGFKRSLLISNLFGGSPVSLSSR